MKSVVRRITTLSAALGALWFVQPAHAVSITVDLATQGTFTANSYSSPAAISLGAPMIVASGGSLDVWIDFLGSQALKLTDIVAGPPPQEQMASIRFGGLFMGSADVSLLLTGVFGDPLLQPNPDLQPCNSAGGTFCNTGGFGDLVNGTNAYVGFDGFHVTYTNTSGGTATLSDISFQFSGESVQRATAAALPEPGTLAIFGIGLAGFAFARRRKAAA